MPLSAQLENMCFLGGLRAEISKSRKQCDWPTAARQSFGEAEATEPHSWSFSWVEKQNKKQDVLEWQQVLGFYK